MAGLAGTFNIDINQNATFTLQFIWQTGGDTPTPIDNTNYSGIIQFRPSVNSPQVLFSGSDQDGTIQLHGTNGQVTVEIPWQNTTSDVVKFTNAFYDILLKNTIGQVFRVMQGTVTVHPGVSVFTSTPDTSSSS